MQQCKYKAYFAECIPLEMKNNIEQMEMELGLYEKVFKISRKDSKFITDNINKAKINSSS